MTSTSRFRQEIRSRLDVAAGQGYRSLIIDAKELYHTLCNGPVFNPAMVFCCNAMRAEMTKADNLIFDDANDSLLTVNYQLPRNSVHS